MKPESKLKPLPNLQKEIEARDTWNLAHPVGTLVTVALDDGTKMQTQTESPATLLQNGIAVIWVKGIAGCYKLDRVKHRVEDLDPEAVRLELSQLFAGQPVGISKTEVWTVWHQENYRVVWDIHIGEPILFRLSDLYGGSSETYSIEQPSTLLDALRDVKTWANQFRHIQSVDAEQMIRCGECRETLDTPQKKNSFCLAVMKGKNGN